jgi:colanic acid biosynthesis glycosyl transferase WcaI
MLSQCFWKPDLVFTIEPTLFSAPIALLTAALAGAPAWLHVQDFEVDAAFDLDLLSTDGPLHALATHLDRLLTRRFARVSTLSHKMLDRLSARGLPPHRARLLPNWADLGHIYPDPSQNLRRELGLEGKIVLLYSGNMGTKQGLEALVPLLAALVPTPSADPLLATPIPGLEPFPKPAPTATIHLLLCGSGAFRPQLESLLAHHPNVTFLPLQPEHRLNALLNTADIHLLPQRRGAADLVMPSKLTGMLASGRPILATADPDTEVADVVRSCGLVVPPGDPAALAAAALRLIADPTLRARLGAAARAYALEHLAKHRILIRFEQDLLSLVSQSSALASALGTSDEIASVPGTSDEIDEIEIAG